MYWVLVFHKNVYDYLIGENFMFGSLGSQLIIVSSSTSEIQNSLQIYNKCSDWMKMLTSCTTKNPNNKLWLCKGCKNLQWAKDFKVSKKKIDFLVEEIRKLGLEVKCLSITFQLSPKELEQMQECKNKKVIIWRRTTKATYPRIWFH